jgi:hypothetical protein
MLIENCVKISTLVSHYFFCILQSEELYGKGDNGCLAESISSKSIFFSSALLVLGLDVLLFDCKSRIKWDMEAVIKYTYNNYQATLIGIYSIINSRKMNCNLQCNPGISIFCMSTSHFSCELKITRLCRWACVMFLAWIGVVPFLLLHRATCFGTRLSLVWLQNSNKVRYGNTHKRYIYNY